VNSIRFAPGVLAILLAASPLIGAQEPALRPITRAEAVAEATSKGSRLALAFTDTAAAAGAAQAVTSYPNPALSAGYSKSAPQYHLSLDQPIEYPWMRSARSDAANEFLRAARYRFVLERAAAQVEADTAYTDVLAARARARLSQRTAADADSLLTIARLRRDAGDASDLDVELATVIAGETANTSANDSINAVDALLELQSVMGLASDRPLIVPTDSLLPPAPVQPPHSDSVTASPLAVAAAEASMRGAERSLTMEQRNVFTTPTIQLGFEEHDPSGSEPGVLPTFGISLPLPLWNQHGGEIALAKAGLGRAQAELAQARRESDARIARARRELAAAIARVTRDQKLLASAQRVAQMSFTAYAEGATGLVTALESQKIARDAVARYVEDVAAAQTAAALLRLHTLTAEAQ
jgi:cobalt-zinc-cadmium efflux system outer membrane protein